MKIGWSKFARNRHFKGSGYSYYEGTDESLFLMLHENWNNRVIGDGAESIDDVCIINLPVEGFVTTKVHLREARDLQASIKIRQEGEDPYVSVSALGSPVEPVSARVVLYAAHELEKNDGERSGDYDWEIVALIVTDDPDEPMHPLCMARNMLEKPGGTPRKYTAEDFAKAIYYWSQFVSFRG